MFVSVEKITYSFGDNILKYDNYCHFSEDFECLLKYH